MKVGGIYVDGSRRISLNMLVEVGVGSRNCNIVIVQVRRILRMEVG